MPTKPRLAYLTTAALLALGCGADSSTYPSPDVAAVQSAGDEASRPDGVPYAEAEEATGGEDARASTVMNASPSMADGAAAGANEPAAQSFRRVSSAPRFATVSLGGGHTLELERLRVSVKVEGLRARTIVEHIFYNPHERAVEGTFRYPLPPEATISSYGMFLGTGTTLPDFFGPQDALRQANPNRMASATVEQRIASVDESAWGEPRIGRIVRATQGRETYENVTRRRVDPALVEEVAPNTFEARIFPIAAHGYHRVLLSYEETLPRVGRDLEYTFSVPDASLDSFEFELAADESLVDRLQSISTLSGVASPSAHTFRAEKHGQFSGGTLAFRVTPKGSRGPVDALAGSNPERNEDFFVLRVQGEASAAPETTGASHAIFMLDTSLSEHPDRYGIDLAILRGVLERSPEIQRFNVMTFDVGARYLSSTWLTNDATTRASTIERLERVLLEGATNLSAALDLFREPSAAMRAGPTSVDVFLLSDGAIDWGESDARSLAAKVRDGAPYDARFFAYRTGLGAENVPLFRALTTQGGTFNCLTTDSVAGCAVAHRRQGMRVERVEIVSDGQNGAVAEDVLVAGREATLVPGGSLMIAGKLAQGGSATLRIVGQRGGREVTLEYPVDLVPRGQLAPRAYAEIAIASLLETRDASLEDLAVALAQHYRVPTRLTSYLVLETDAEYEQYGLTQAQGRAGAEISTLVSRSTQGHSARRSAFSRIDRILRDANERNHVLQIEGGATYRALSGFVGGQDELLPSQLVIPLVERRSVPQSYVQAIAHEPDALEVFGVEADRRRAQGELGAAVRALSSIVENDPGSAEAARLVAYRLEAWGASDAAATLFVDVLEKRPYEPQSYRDLANALHTRRPAIAAALYEASIAGSWDARFGPLQVVLREEYALFVRTQRREHPAHPFSAFLGDRSQALGLTLPSSDLRVTMTWNTDNTDIDLWVTDPDGEKCYYGHRTNSGGGELLDDVTQGFGPERFQDQEADEGRYLVQAHYYGNNGNRLVAETHVTLTVATHLGQANERVRRYVVVLQPGEVAEIARVDF